MKVNLDDVVKAIETVSDYTRYYYLIDEERVIPYNPEDEIPYEPNEYIILPDRKDVDDYGNMERFIQKVGDDTIREWLSNAIRGRGAFRMFRAALERFHMLNEWYDYRDMCHRVTAMDWCEDNGIEYEGPRYVIEEDYDDDFDDDEDEWFEPKPVLKKPEPVKPEYKTVKIGNRNFNQLVFLVSAFTDERLEKNGYRRADDPDEALNKLEAAMKDGCIIHAISDHGRYIGYSIVHEEEGRAIMDEIYIRPELRRKGLGRMLVKQAENDAAESERTLEFDIQPSENDFIAFLGKCGYSVLTTLTLRKADGQEEGKTVTLDGVKFLIPNV